MTCLTPPFLSQDTMWSMSGTPTRGKSNFGFEQLRGLSRVAYPPASIIPFIGLCQLCFRYLALESRLIVFTTDKPSVSYLWAGNRQVVSSPVLDRFSQNMKREYHVLSSHRLLGK